MTDYRFYSNPTLCAEWDDKRNGRNFENVSRVSEKVWWKCEKNHSWAATVSNRLQGRGCPYCSGHLPIVGETDLATLNPELASELDLGNPDNKGVTAQNLTAKSSKKIWWKCKEGHRWSASVFNRTSGSGCPYCSGRLPIMGETDLATLNPELASELDVGNPDNKGVTAQNLTARSSKKIWWKCKEGHKWAAKVSNRIYGKGCPYCSGRYPIMGKTDLATLNPALAAELDMENLDNEGIEPWDLAVKSKKKVWWKCEKGHEWVASVYSRTEGSSCPYCSGYLPVTGETDLATLNPVLASELDIGNSDNKGITAQNLTVSSHKKVWWKCEKGHKWAASVYSRTEGSGCPYCSGYYPIIGETDLATINPLVASELDEENPKNRGVRAQNLSAGSEKKVWWKCEKGHKWAASVKNRANGKGCPYCCKR